MRLELIAAYIYELRDSRQNKGMRKKEKEIIIKFPHL